MEYSWTPGAFLPFLSAGLALVACFLAWRSKQVPASKPFIVIQVCAFIWCFFYGLELCVTRLADAILFANIEYLGMVLLPPASAVFALAYSDRLRKPSAAGWVVLAIQPIVVLPLVLTNVGHVFRVDPHLEKVGGHFLLAFGPGPGYLFNVAISHLTLLYVWSTFLFLALKRGNPFRRQARTLFISYVFPVLGNVIYHLGFHPVPHYDITPAMFSLCGGLITYSLFRQSIFDLAPIARSTTVEQLLDPVIVLNVAGQLIDCNQAAATILGDGPERLLGTDGYALLNEKGFFSESSVEEGALYHHGERVFTVRVSEINEPFRGEVGRVLHMTDLTERLQLERNLEAARRSADDANSAKSNFLANMSHEIRTPMNGVIGLADLLNETPLSPLQLEYVQAVQSCSRSLMHIIDEILDFSKIEAGKMSLNPEPVDLIKLINDVVAAHRVIAESKGLSFEVGMPESSWLGVQVDPSALRQILNNLIGNAVKFTSSGRIEVLVRILRDDEFRFEITDTGIGIPIEMIETVFDRFSQADSTSTRQFGGTGLGLTISRQFVQMMGGQIHVSSKVGEGSHFWVDLSLPRVELPLPVQSKSSRFSLKVLLAEDNPINTMVIQHQLEQLECHVVHCADGKQAVETFMSERFDVVLMDVQMPVLGGIEACIEIRRRSPVRIPIIALTANALEDERVRCLDAGMDAFLTKPTTTQQLSDALDQVAKRT